MTPAAAAHLTHDELADPHEMALDAAAAGRHLSPDAVAQVAALVVQAPPSIHYEDFPQEIRKPEIRIDDATALLAAAVFPVLD